MELFAEIFEIGVGLTKQYGFFFKFWLGPEIKITVQDPKDIEVSASEKSPRNNRNFLFKRIKRVFSFPYATTITSKDHIEQP